jgi:RNA polymerase sigma factor (sigma-70 family)
VKKLTRTQEIEILHQCIDCGQCDQIVTQYERLIYNTILSTGKKISYHFSGQMIEDLSQEIFVELFSNNCKRLRAYNQSKGLSLANWIVLIATHTIYNHLKKKKDAFNYSSVKKMTDIQENHELNRLITNDTENKLEARQQLLLIDECLENDNINDYEKLVFKYHYFMGLSFDVISQLTHRKLSTIHSDKSRAVSKIKDCVESKR